LFLGTGLSFPEFCAQRWLHPFGLWLRLVGKISAEMIVFGLFREIARRYRWMKSQNGRILGWADE